MLPSANGPPNPTDSPRKQLEAFVAEAEIFFGGDQPFARITGISERVVGAGKLYEPGHPPFDHASVVAIRACLEDDRKVYNLTLSQLGLLQRFCIIEGDGGKVLDSNGNTLHQIGNFNLVRDIVGSLAVDAETTRRVAEHLRDEEMAFTAFDFDMGQLFKEAPYLEHLT